MISQMLLWTLIETAVALGQLLRRRRCVRLAEWMPPVGGAFAESGAPVGGAPSRRTITSAGSWDIQAKPDSSELVGGPQRASGAPKQMPCKCQGGARQMPSRCRADAEATSS
jgi:hypothetical protein